VEFRVLGPLTVEGVPSLGGSKQRTMLALLLLSAGEVVSGDRFITGLWRDRTPPASAEHALQVYVSRLRQLIVGTGATIERHGNGYTLDLGASRLDRHRFEELAGQGSRLLAEGAAEPARVALAEALALWRGHALADLDGSVGAELDARRLAATEDLTDAELTLGRHAELVPQLEQHVREEPLRERLRGQLIVALYRSGRQAAALAEYRSAREALDKLGLEPGPTLRELEVSILRQDEALAVEPAGLRERRKLRRWPRRSSGAGTRSRR